MVELCEGKMAELEVSVPLAQFDTEEWAEFSDFQSSQDPNCNSEPHNMTCTTPDKNDNNDILDNVSDTTDTFKDSFSASLEDLVNTFDEKITKCFCNYEDQVEKYAPVQVRTQEEIMNECQMWWTITGNFGNILPIDWSKTYTRQQYLPVLNLNEMKEGSSSEDECVESSSSGENMQDIPTRPCPPHLYHDKLKSMSVPELNEALMELELVIRRYSETLITQLALRDELEYEKELKNSFISLLLQVQNKRRNFNIEKKKQKKVGPNGTDPKYLTTVIPYDVGHGPPQNPTLQILIKILTAINEDSPTVPTLLTDYILKVLCPS
ncbi:fasciculation and elongation protein zeta-2-like isoform X4 [Scylla paramamosain]|uniref:fasciculation and elongation protein zeta-2-like isoform X4 n=1 Tax=Scylla paramamosain TaxID=85552 RepID=UPI003083C7FF